MYVNQVRSAGVAATGGKRRVSGASGFDAHMRTGDVASSGGSGSSGAVGQVLAMDALVALQSVEPDGAGQRQQLDRSSALLDELDSLKADLLSGRVDGRRLNRIQQLVARHAQVEDPALADLIAQIDLRAQVEMAKLGH
ncbi:MAG: flagellar assembly protein FliX [Pseudomonadota bacterium]